MAVSSKQKGIPRRMFKAVIASSHPEFSSMRQQDALEFFLHFIDQVERANAGKPELDPSRSFKFGIEEKIICPSGKVAYNKRLDYILSLNIPLHAATNAEELDVFNKLKAEGSIEGTEISADQVVRPRVPLDACLSTFSAPEEVQDFYGTALKAKATAVKTAGLTSFPDYLVLHMRKFVMEAGWVPKKLDVYIDVPDIIDISHMRSKGIQPGEELLPEADIDNPISKDWQGSIVDQSQVDTLLSFGFPEDIARKALKATRGDIGKAADWIFNNPDSSGPSDTDASSSSLPTATEAVLSDGEGKYRLMGIISHMVTSTQCGHYVAHIYKDGRWVVFNDDKVGASINPPKDMGYLYFFERIKC